MTIMTAGPQGTCDTRFATVRDAFLDNFSKRGDVGAAVCVYVDGRPVVDLWGGFADAARTRPWAQDTITSVASTTKGMTALCAHMLVEAGLLDLDAPVARYWPEFAGGGKGDILVRWLLSHRAGLPAVRRDMATDTLFDWNAFATALVETDPWWEPGTQHGYHSRTYGFLVGEVVRRISGKTVGEFFRTHVAEPLGVDFYLGVPGSEDARAAEVVAPPPRTSGEPTRLERLMQDPLSLTFRAFSNPAAPTSVINTRAWRAAEIPSSNGHTTARAVARIYGALARGGALDGIRLLSASTIDAAIVEQSRGVDAVHEQPARYGLGFMLPLREHFQAFGFGAHAFGPGARAFGHWGMGGSVGFADPDGRVGFGYVMNQYKLALPDNPDLRWPSLVEAVYAVL
jgi:CubicO group peptidase (beta-lactamase class C family)